MPHCYGVVGVARGTEANSGTGASLYVIIGQSPRRLDLNITTVGRVLKGMELLSALPRGTGNLGFYDKPEQLIRWAAPGCWPTSPPPSARRWR